MSQRNSNNPDGSSRIAALLVLGLAFLGVFALGIAQTPVFKFSSVDKKPGQLRYYSHFVNLDENATSSIVQLRLTTTFFSPNKFLVKADDCLRRLVVNGIEFEKMRHNDCNFRLAQFFDFSRAIRLGRNEIIAEIENLAGPSSVQIRPDPFDHHVLAITALLAIFGTFFWVTLAKERLWIESTSGLWIFAAGVATRIVYLQTTPFDVRTYDISGHLEYIQFVADNWKIPSATQGWCMHHAPGYYFFMAAIQHGLEFFGCTPGKVLTWFPFVSLQFSIVSLILLFRITALTADRRIKSYLNGMWAFFPALLMLTSRVTNDVALVPLLIAGLYFTLHWVNDGNSKAWWMAAVCNGVAATVKQNGLVGIACQCFALLIRPQLPVRIRVEMLLKTALLQGALCGWYFAYRSFIDKKDFFSQQAPGLSSLMAIQQTWVNYVTFNPFEILANPFFSPWPRDLRRANFLESLYRSAFFGEFMTASQWNWLAQTILLVGFAILIFAGFNALQWFHNRSAPTALLVIAAFMSLAALMVWLARDPFACNQDYRFVPLLGAAIFGLAARPTGCGRTVITLQIAAFASLAAFCAFLIFGWITQIIVTLK